MDHRGDNNISSNKIVFTVAILGFAALVVLTYITYKPSEYKEFSPTSFYVGNAADSVDPKKLRDKMSIGTKLGDAECRSEMRKPTYGIMCNRYSWLRSVSEEGLKTEEPDRGFLAVHMMKPYTDGDEIVAPTNLRFINTNNSLSVQGQIYIEAYTVGNYIIRWDNIKCWWCHEGKSEPMKHSVKMGIGGKFSTCYGNWVIGIAKEDTIVTIYKEDENGLRSEATFEDLYYN